MKRKQTKTHLKQFQLFIFYKLFFFAYGMHNSAIMVFFSMGKVKSLYYCYYHYHYHYHYCYHYYYHCHCHYYYYYCYYYYCYYYYYYNSHLNSFNCSCSWSSTTSGRPFSPLVPIAFHGRTCAFHFPWLHLRLFCTLLCQASTTRLVNCYNSFYERREGKKIAFEIREEKIAEEGCLSLYGGLMLYKSSLL